MLRLKNSYILLYLLKLKKTKKIFNHFYIYLVLVSR